MDAPTVVLINNSDAREKQKRIEDSVAQELDESRFFNLRKAKLAWFLVPECWYQKLVENVQN